MTEQDGTFRRVSVTEAARALGVSPSTVRRLVKPVDSLVRVSYAPRGAPT